MYTIINLKKTRKKITKLKNKNKMKSKKILVTGGAGFIGSHLVDRLVNEGHNVVVIDSLEKQVHKCFPDYLNPKADYYFNRLENCPLLNSILDGVEVIFHCASKVGVSQSQYEIQDFINANIGATASLLQKCIKSSVKKIILSGSMAPYGEGPHLCSEHNIVYPETRSVSDMSKKIFECKCPSCNKPTTNIPINEEQNFSGLSYYAITKQTQELMIHLFGKIYGVKTISLRYFSVYGSRQTIGNSYAGPIPIFIERISNKERPLVFEDGCQTRDFVHVSDVVNANLLAMNAGISQKSYNIGTGKKTSILELANEVCNLIKTNLKPLVTNEFRVGDIRHSLADISKAENELKYKPLVSLKEGLKEVLEWAKNKSKSVC